MDGVKKVGTTAESLWSVTAVRERRWTPRSFSSSRDRQEDLKDAGRGCPLWVRKVGKTLCTDEPGLGEAQAGNAGAQPAAE